MNCVELLKKCKDCAKTVKKYTVEDLALDCYLVKLLKINFNFEHKHTHKLI